MSERLVVVRNPSSANAKRVGHQVIDRLNDEGFTPHVIGTPSPDYDVNVEHLAEKFQDGDRIIVAGGDGTSSQVFNAAIASGKEGLSIGFEGFGTLNDTAAVYNGKERPIDPTILARSQNLIGVRPIQALVNDEHFRYSHGYVTIGWTAFGSHEFMTPEIRERHKELPKHLLTALCAANSLALYYRRRKSMALPRFTVGDDRELHTLSTDVIALNQSRMGRIIGDRSAKPDSDTFLYKELDNSTIWRNVPMYTQAFAGYMPGEDVSTQQLNFSAPADFWIQTEGEAKELQDVKTLTFTKQHPHVVDVVIP